MRSIGYVASSGSGVQVPNIVDLSTSAASSALSAVGLALGSSTGSTTSGATSGNNGYVATQSVAPGTTADYGTVISYTTYNYVPPCTPNWTVQTIWSNCTSCVKYSNDYHTDGCGNSYFDNPQGPVACDSGDETQTDEYDELIGATSTECNYRLTKVYTNTCTNAVRYEYSYYSLGRGCPTCICPGV